MVLCFSLFGRKMKVYRRMQVLVQCLRQLKTLKFVFALDANACRANRRRVTRKFKSCMEKMTKLVEGAAVAGIETQAFNQFLRKTTTTFEEAKRGGMVAMVADMRSILVAHGVEFDALFGDVEKNAKRIRLVEYVRKFTTRAFC